MNVPLGTFYLLGLLWSRSSSELCTEEKINDSTVKEQHKEDIDIIETALEHLLSYISV